jgi:hypothetical protein
MTRLVCLTIHMLATCNNLEVCFVTHAVLENAFDVFQERLMIHRNNLGRSSSTLSSQYTAPLCSLNNSSTITHIHHCESGYRKLSRVGPRKHISAPAERVGREVYDIVGRNVSARYP